MKNIEELTITELYQMVNDLHALMWMGNGCEVCAHCITVHKEPYYKTKCALDGECNPLWRGFEQSEAEESRNCWTCEYCGDGEEINDYGHCWLNNGEDDDGNEFTVIDREKGCDKWTPKVEG